MNLNIRTQFKQAFSPEWCFCLMLTAGWITYILHGSLDGIVFSSRLVSISVFSGIMMCLVMVLYKIAPKAEPVIHKGNRWIIIGLASMILGFSIWLGRVGFPGDYNIHKMFTLHLLNGNPERHYFYQDAFCLYPPLAHVLLAMTSNITGLNVHNSYMLSMGLLRLAIAFYAFRLASRWMLSLRASLFFSALITLYGGFIFSKWRLFHLYLPSLQNSVPYISRSLGFLFFIVFLSMIGSMHKSEERKIPTIIAIGFFTGLCGWIHPTSYIMCVAVIAGSMVYLSFNRPFPKSCLIKLSLVFLVSVIVFAFFYVPALIRANSTGHYSQLQAMEEMWPSSMTLYWPLAIWIIPFLILRKYDPLDYISFIMLIGFVSLQLIWRSIGTVESGLGVMLRVHSYGAYFFFFLARMAAKGSEVVAAKKAQLYISTVLMTVFCLVGAFTMYRYLDNWKIVRLSALKKEISQMFPSRGIESMRKAVEDPKKNIMAPSRISFRLACEAGLFVVYCPQAKVTEHFYQATIPASSRQQAVEEFYQSLQKGTVTQDILSEYGSGCFLAPSELEISSVEYETCGRWQIINEQWTLYQKKPVR